jgi:hypothetical protein
MEDAQKRTTTAGGTKNVHQTPPTKKKSTKTERASMLCSTPPTCIKDKDSHVEYTRKEFLGEARSVLSSLLMFRVDLLDVIWLQTDKIVHLLLKSSQKHLSKLQKRRERYTMSMDALTPVNW